MHHKFCILDGRDVLTGSYNWTNKAAKSNEENLVLTTGDPELAHHFLREFRRLTGQRDETAGDPAVQRVLKRLAVRLTAVLTALRAHRYTEAITRLQEFIAAYSQVRVWQDPLLPALQLEIRLLEAEILALEAERADAYRQLTAFELRHQHELGELLQEVLGLRRDVASFTRQESAYSESEYQQAKQRYQQQTQDREAAQLCHPDRVAPAHQSAATYAFQQLQQAYQHQDLAGIQAQLHNLRQGIFSTITPLTSVENLTARRNALASNHAQLLQELAEIRTAEAYSLAQADEETREAYLTTNRTILQAERDRLTAQFELLSQQAAAPEVK